MKSDHTQHAVQTPPAQQPAPTADDKAVPAHDDKAMQTHDGKRVTKGSLMEHQGAHWAHFANMALGLWLIAGVFALGYRSTALQVSDAVSGALVIIFAILSLSPRPWLKFWSPWANSLVGLWLLFAHVRRLRQRYVGRRARHRLRHPGAGDADGTGDEHEARPERTAWLVVQPIELATACTDYRPRARRLLPLAADDRLPTPAHHIDH